VAFTKAICARIWRWGGWLSWYWINLNQVITACALSMPTAQKRKCAVNGARCMASYIVANLKPVKKLFRMETLAGEIFAEAKDEVATVRLSDPKDYNPDMNITVAGNK